MFKDKIELLLAMWSFFFNSFRLNAQLKSIDKTFTVCKATLSRYSRMII